MPVRATMTASKFCLLRRHEPACLKAIKRWDRGDDARPVIQRARTLETVFEAFGFDVTRNGAGTISDLGFEAQPIDEHFFDLDTFFVCIAPYVKKGSYLAMSGGESDPWVWKFNGHTCRRIDEAADHDEEE